MEMNYCRRCGTVLVQQGAHSYHCKNNHVIYANSSLAVAIMLLNSSRELLTVRRALEPGVGQIDLPGGFCDDHELAEAAIERELLEEVGLRPGDYTKPVFFCTGMDDYVFRGETVPVLSLIYTATITDETLDIVGRDDATDVTFTDFEDIEPADFFFVALQGATAKLERSLHELWPRTL